MDNAPLEMIAIIIDLSINKHRIPFLICYEPKPFFCFDFIPTGRRGVAVKEFVATVRREKNSSFRAVGRANVY